MERMVAMTSADNPAAARDAAAAGLQLPSQVSIAANWVLHHDAVAQDLEHQILESPDGTFYQLGRAEAEFFDCLLETKSVEAAIAKQNAVSSESMKLERINKFLEWILRIGAVEGVGATAPTTASKGNWLSSLFYLRVPLIQPDAILQRLTPKMGLLFSWQSFVVGSLLVLLGGCILLAGWEEFIDCYHNLFTPSRGLFLFVAWIGLKCLHEFAHAMTCKRYGGDVKQAGIALFALMPVAYVDVSSCWRFASRWPRIHVTLAGVIAEMTIAGAAMILWGYTASLLAKQMMADIILLVFVNSLLFNLNPLLKFDGYFLLSDLSRIPNLYQVGQQYARYFGMRYILGVEQERSAAVSANAIWIRAYALSAAVWRFITVIGILGGVSILLEGAGVLLAIAGGFCFLLLPLYQLGRSLMLRRKQGELRLSILLARLALIAGVGFSALFFVPAEFRRTVPGIVEYNPPAVLRPASDGFVEQVLVRNGEEVEEGQALLIMRNEDLLLELWSCESQLSQAEQQIRSARWKGDESLLKEAATRRNGLQKKAATLQEQVDGLTIRAPHSGRVVARNFAMLQGTFLEQGVEIGAVGNESRKRLKLTLGTWEASRSAGWLDTPVKILVPGHLSWSEKLDRLESRATEKPADPSLTAEHHGPLAVRIDKQSKEPVLLEPRVTAFVPLSPSKSKSLLCGQRCSARISCTSQSIGGRVLELLSEYLTI